MELFLITLGVFAVYFVVVFVNTWCLAAMLVVAIDHFILQDIEKKSLTKPIPRVTLYIVKDKENP